MNDLLSLLFIFSLVVFAVSTAYGVNIRKWYGWVQVFFAFLCGFLMGSNIAERMIAGIFFAGMAIWLGSIIWKRRQRYQEGE